VFAHWIILNQLRANRVLAAEIDAETLVMSERPWRIASAAMPGRITPGPGAGDVKRSTLRFSG
jgi:hypothetical protein